MRTAAVTCVTSVLLDHLGLWSFSWRAAGSTAPLYVGLLRDGARWDALGIWTFTTVVIIPFVEEVVFRFAVLAFLARFARSAWVGIGGSAALFAAGHLGQWPPRQVDPDRVLALLWLFAFAVVLGWMVRRWKTIAVGTVAHGARNAVEVLTLISTVR
jgi:membrane protease YdiL (CAAX protease family)